MQALLNVDEDGAVTGVALWHPVDGKWVHVAQKFPEEGGIVYFTGGVQQTVVPPPTNEMINIMDEVRRKQDDTGGTGDTDFDNDPSFTTKG